MTVVTTPSSTIHPARKGPRPVTANDMWAIPRVGVPAPSSDGQICIVPVTTYNLEKNVGLSRLWLLPLDGSEPRALTAADRTSAEPALSPDGRWLAYESDESGEQ